jgi:hypothetical protein
VDPRINATLYSAVTNIHRQSQDLNEVERSFEKVLSEPRNPHLKDQVARVDQIVQDQLEYLHDLYNNPAVEGYSFYPKAHYQQEMRSAYHIAMDKLKRIRQDMLAHDKGTRPQAEKTLLEPIQPAAANPVQMFMRGPGSENAVFSIGHLAQGANVTFNGQVIVNGQDVTDRHSPQVYNSPLQIYMPSMPVMPTMPQTAQPPRDQFRQLGYNAAMNEALHIPAYTSGVTATGNINSIIKIEANCSSITVNDGVNGMLIIGANCSGITITCNVNGKVIVGDNCSNIRVSCGVESKVEIGNNCSHVYITRNINSTYSIGHNCTNIVVDNDRVR